MGTSKNAASPDTPPWKMALAVLVLVTVQCPQSLHCYAPTRRRRGGTAGPG
jgi:hypothetical protein